MQGLGFTVNGVGLGLGRRVQGSGSTVYNSSSSQPQSPPSILGRLSETAFHVRKTHVHATGSDQLRLHKGSQRLSAVNARAVHVPASISKWGLALEGLGFRAKV